MNANYITHLESKKMSEKTIQVYVNRVNSLLDFVSKEDKDITTYDIENWMSSMSNLSGASIAQSLSAVKSYFRYLSKENIIVKDPAANIDSPHYDNKPKHYMDAEMVSNMILHAKNYRDKAIVITLVSTGMRVGEMTNLTLSQYKHMKETGDNKITIIGKGNKRRFVFFNQETQDAIDKYLANRDGSKIVCDRLFTSNWGGPIHANNLSQTLKTIAKNAGIPFYEDMCNHQLRAACATIMNAKEVPLTTIQYVLGHSNINTTMRYTKINPEDAMSAVNSMNFAI